MGDGKELRGVTKEGVIIPVEIALSPIESDSGRLISAAIRDITDRKRREEKVSQHLRNLEWAKRLAGIGYYEKEFSSRSYRISNNFQL